MKVADLEGEALNYWVARAEGLKIIHDPLGKPTVEAPTSVPVDWKGKFFCRSYEAGHGVCHEQCNDCTRAVSGRSVALNFSRFAYSPSTNWSQGGPIIERERITLNIDVTGWCAEAETRSSRGLQTTGLTRAEGSTPLIAAMRAYVESKFGEEVVE